MEIENWQQVNIAELTRIVEGPRIPVFRIWYMNENVEEWPLVRRFHLYETFKAMGKDKAAFAVTYAGVRHFHYRNRFGITAKDMMYLIDILSTYKGKHVLDPNLIIEER